MTENRYMVWIDLEMTGFDPEVVGIIEIATILTDSELNIVAEGPVFCIKQSTPCWRPWMNGIRNTIQIQGS